MKKKLVSLLLTLCLFMTMFSVTAFAMPIYVQAAAHTDTVEPIKLGEYVELGTYNGEDILWRCVAFEKGTRQSDGSILIDSTQTSATYSAVGENEGDNGYLPLMVSDKIITIKAFDANGTTQGSHSRDSSNRNSYGSNYWGDSNLRDWLNSEAASVTWTDGNAPTKAKCNNYNGYDQEAGFLSSDNFSDQAKKAIARNVKQKSLLHSADESEKDSVSGTAVHTYNQNINSVVQDYASAMYRYETDSVFCLDVQQLSNMYNNTKNDTNASGSAYYIGTPTAGAVEQSDYTDSSLATGTNWYYWLRAPYYRFSLYVRSVGSGGQVDGSRAYYGDGGVRPAFFLNPAAANFDFGSGTSDAPYRFYKGEGTAESPYEIPDLETLEAFRDKVNGGETYEGKHFKLTADIDMSGTYSASTGTSWTPIGTKSSPFSGIFDGANNKIDGLYINSLKSYQGLFGYISHGTVQNLAVSGYVSSSDEIIGGVVAYSAGGIVSKCSFSGNVYGTYYIAGVVGWTSGGSVLDCNNSGAISAEKGYVGGVLGESNGGTVTGCYNTGEISGKDRCTGGVAGWINYPLTDCYNTGTVIGKLTTGGIVGSSGGTITGCYNTGMVTGTRGYTGGILGTNDNTVINCYNIGEIAGKNVVGGICGQNIGRITSSYSFETVSGASDVGGVCGSNYGTIENCYYNNGTYTATDTTAGVIGKTTAEFASGEVAHLLQGDSTEQIWGQALSGSVDASPVLMSFLTDEEKVSKTVYKVIFKTSTNENYAARYANSGGTVELPAAPTMEGYDFAKWADAEGAEFTSGTPVNTDMTVSAVWTEKSKIVEITPDATVDLPGGGTVTGNADGTVTITDTHGTATTITPPADGDKVTVNTETGEITVPVGSTVKTDETGAEITLPQGGKVKPDGTVTVPEGGTVTITDGTDTTTITPPSGGEILPSEDGGVHVDKGATVQTGNGPVITLPESGDGGTVQPGGSVVGTPIQVDNSLITISATDPTGDIVTTDKNGNVTLPGGTAANVDKDGDGTPDVTVTIPAGKGSLPADPGTVKPNGDIELPGGSTVAITDGGDNTTITLPSTGGIVTPGENGAVTVPGGSTVTTGGQTVTIPENGGTVAPGGEVTYTVTVTFDAQNGSPTTSQTILTGSKATKPSDPTRNGYTFDGWYTEAACTIAWDFDTAVTGNMTLYAKWTKKNNPVTPAPDTPDEPTPPVWENHFTDIKENDWYYEAVEFANENGLFYGTSDTVFGPNEDMSRGMLAAVLYRLAKEPGTAADDLFSDVAGDKYYTEAIVWAADNNIVAGYGNNRFGPEDSITREQFATILWRYAGSPESTGSLNSFTDGNKAAEYAIPALQWAVEQKIVSGKGNGILDPRGKATRAEVAAMLMRYCGKAE